MGQNYVAGTFVDPWNISQVIFFDGVNLAVKVTVKGLAGGGQVILERRAQAPESATWTTVLTISTDQTLTSQSEVAGNMYRLRCAALGTVPNIFYELSHQAIN